LSITAGSKLSCRSKKARSYAGTSVDTLKREHRKGRLKLERVSERRWSIRRREALMR